MNTSSRIGLWRLLVPVLVVAWLPASPGPATAQVSEPPPAFAGSVDWNDVQQRIDGFGASGAFWQPAQLMKFPQADRRRILDMLFCGDAIPSESAPQDQDGMPVCQTPGIDASMVRNQIKPNCAARLCLILEDGDKDQIWLMREALRRGDTTFFSTPWSAPGWMKNKKDEVDPAYYPAYADYLAEYVLGMRDIGLTIDAVSVANEPEVTGASYGSMAWNGEQFRVFLRDHLRPVFAVKGIDSDVLIPESVYWSEQKALPTLNDPLASSRLDIVAGHSYHGWHPYPFKKATEAGKRIWQTEDSDLDYGERPTDPSINDALRWAGKMNRYLTDAEVNAWNYWWLVTEKASGEAFINLNMDEMTYLVNKRMYAFGNFSRFVRPGWTRIGTTVPHSRNVEVSAFKDPATGRFSIVAINHQTNGQPLDLSFNGFKAAEVVPYTTSDALDLERGDPVATSSGHLVTSLPARSVTTFVGGPGVATSPFNVNLTDSIVWNRLEGTATATVTNVSGTPASGTLRVDASEGLSASPDRTDFVLAPGESRVVDVRLLVDSLESQADYGLSAWASTAPDGVKVRASSVVRMFTDRLDICPNTPVERAVMFDADAKVFSDWALSCGGNPRFADAPLRFVYRFDLPSDTQGGEVTLHIGNQFLVEASTDGTSWRTVLRETDTSDNARLLKNLAKRSLDLNDLRAGGHVLFLRVGDSQPADGWGGFLLGTSLHVER